MYSEDSEPKRIVIGEVYVVDECNHVWRDLYSMNNYEKSIIF